MHLPALHLLHHNAFSIWCIYMHYHASIIRCISILCCIIMHLVHVIHSCALPYVCILYVMHISAFTCLLHFRSVLRVHFCSTAARWAHVISETDCIRSIRTPPRHSTAPSRLLCRCCFIDGFALNRFPLPPSSAFLFRSSIAVHTPS